MSAEVRAALERSRAKEEQRQRDQSAGIEAARRPPAPRQAPPPATPPAPATFAERLDAGEVGEMMVQLIDDGQGPIPWGKRRGR